MTETSGQAKDELYTAGRWVSASGTGRIEMISPSTEQLVYSVPEATEAEIDGAVRAARQVFEAGTWSALSPGERAGHLFRFAEALTDRADKLTVTLANEMGAPVGTAREVQGTAGLTQFFAAHAEKVQFEETRSGRSGPVSSTGSRSASSRRSCRKTPRCSCSCRRWRPPCWRAAR